MFCIALQENRYPEPTVIKRNFSIEITYNQTEALIIPHNLRESNSIIVLLDTCKYIF